MKHNQWFNNFGISLEESKTIKITWTPRSWDPNTPYSNTISRLLFFLNHNLKTSD